MAAAEPSLTPEQSKMPERARHDRRAGDRLLGHFLAELGARVQCTVLVVLPRDAGDHFLELGLVDAELLGVGRRQQAEGGRRGERGARAVADAAAAGQAGVAGVLQLLDADGHGDVVGAGGDGVAGVAERLGAGGAVVLQAADRLVVDLERPRQREPALTREERAEPEGVDWAQLDAGRGQGLAGGVDQQVAGALVPVLAERRAAHADDRDAITNAVAGHQSVPPRSGLAFQK